MLVELTAILSFVAVMLIGSGIALALASQRRHVARRLERESRRPDRTHQKQPIERAALEIGRRIGPSSASTTLQEQLGRAGYYSESAAATFVGVKFILLALGAAGTALLLASLRVPLALAAILTSSAAAFAFFLPNIHVMLRRSRRLAEVRDYLPDAVDLMEICVSSGMGLDMAWNSVGDEIRRVCPVLADEMALVSLEVQLGAPRPEAMRNMARRTGANDLGSLVALLIQSDRFGTSIADALRTFATSMRESRSFLAEERAEKMAVHLLFPLVLFIFPVIFIVVVGPAAIMLLENLGGVDL